MLDFKDLYTIDIDNEKIICKLLSYNQNKNTYTISLGSSCSLFDVDESQLTDISFKRPIPVVNNGVIQNTWAELSLISRSRNYTGLSIGDRKEILLDGYLTTHRFVNYSVWAYIIGFDHNPQYENKGITFQLFIINNSGTYEPVSFICGTQGQMQESILNGTIITNLNHWGTSAQKYSTLGGWKGCDLRYDVLGSTDIPPSDYGALPTATRQGYDATPNCPLNPVQNTLMSCLPIYLRQVMKPMKKYTDAPNQDQNIVVQSIDYLPLLSPYELFSNTTINTGEKNYSALYEYYQINTTTTRKTLILGNKNITACAYWLRTPVVTSGTNFRLVGRSGSLTSWQTDRNEGISPIFLI